MPAKQTNTNKTKQTAESVANDIKKTAEQFQQNMQNAAQNNAQKFQSAAQQTIQEALNTVQNSFQNGVETMTESCNKAFGTYQQQAQQAGESFQENIQEVTKQVQENVNSVVEGVNTFNQRFEQIGSAYMQLAQNLFDRNVSAAKSIMSCKNANEAFDIQSNTARENMDHLINQGAKISQMGIDATNQAIEPIQNRFNNVVEAGFGKKVA